MKIVKNIITKKVGEVPKYITSMMKANIPVPFWGAFGVGKSQIISEVAKAEAKKRNLIFTEDWKHIGSDEHYVLIDMRLSYMLPEDIKGIPIVDKEKKTREWTVNNWFPKKGFGMLFLDEFNLASMSIQSSAYQLVNDREVAGNKISDDFYILMAGNRGIEDGVKVNTMATPLLNRMGHIEITNMADGGGLEWLQWASENDIHSDICGFLENQPQKIWSYKQGQDGREATSPRVWEKASDLIKNEKEIDFMGELVGIMTNKSIGIEFSTFVSLRGAFNIDKIIEGKEDMPESPEKIYSVIGGIIGKLKENPKLMGKILMIDFKEMLEFKIYLMRQIYGISMGKPKVNVEFQKCLKKNVGGIIDFLDKMA